MRAVRVRQPGGPGVLRCEAVPDPAPRPGQALVRVDAAGVNYFDVYCRSGLTRPNLMHHVATRGALLARAHELLEWVRTGRLGLRMDFVFPLEAAAEAHRVLEGRRTIGKVLLLP